MAVHPVLLVDLPLVRSVPSRQTLVLTVQSEGYPAPHFEWFRSSDHVVVDLMAVRPVLLVDLPRVVVDLMAVRPVLLVDLPRVRSVPSRQTLVLTVQAEGYPAPHFEWFNSSDHVVVDLMAVHPVLLVDLPRVRSVPSRQTLVLTVQAEGYPAPHYEWFRSSDHVVVDLMAVHPVLLVDLPRVRSVPSRQTLVLTVQAEGYPAPHYEWFRSSDDDCAMPNIVLNESSNLIEVKNAGLYDEGLYCCRVYNEAGEIFSSTCRLSVFERPPDDYLASAKVALLIGNEDYLDAELQGLHAPSNDVAVLASILSRLGFHVVALHNLTRTEMYNAFRWFCSILPENAYAFFYFAGHGFSKLASKFMMPIDCPKEEIQLHDCLCDEQLTQILAQGEQLQLLVMLFDCCLVESRDLSIGRTEFEHDLGNCNIVLGTATRNYQNAYESDADANGLFVNHLREHLEDNLPIIEVLRANQRDFREKQQQPTIFFSGADNCSLTDPVVENAQLEEKLRSEVDFEVEKKIYFKRINKGFTIHITKNKNCFLNSVDLQFPEDFTYNFSVEINSQDVKLAVEHRTVTIHNLQRVKSCLYITVFINGLRREDEGFVSGPHDSCEFTLNCPIIQRQLWHNPGTYDPILNPTMLGS
ncbi:mucosa-associated lymphoid tissue lymphoma translocation protein 1-like [Macrosteles quadrilineatus]|uniref:mucosa-associated lymphoid tissue lymphoma translocation protein 1-like n=1 Tax=Macrosteles quadrilineatus TaxID=74068 RepID=UPI0023E142C2|nr:mucosa-associated lymphoid tissue lymphoma translocation protein 1-like [Macrosteles quadrilineatus]